MKKFAPALITLGVIIIGIALFSLLRSTAVAPTPEEAEGTTTEEVQGNTESSPLGVGLPAGSVKRVVKAYANPAWDVRLRYDPEWNLSANGDLITIGSVSANFMVSKGQAIAEPARLESSTKTRTILGEEVAVTRFDNPNQQYAFYEYFMLEVEGTTYYFKISSLIDPNPKVEEFIGNITVQ